MNINKEICIAEGLLLSTWFQIDALAVNKAAQNVFTETTCCIFMAVTAIYFLSFLIRKDKSIMQLGKALWKSSYFDGMTTLALVLPWTLLEWSSDTFIAYLSYALWGLAIVTFLFGIISNRDRSLDSHEIQATDK